MQLSPETPKLPKLPFFVADAVLLVAAALIFHFSAKPLVAGPLVAITICVALAAACGLLPFLLDYTRERDEELASQQRALEALARTTAETAEQIGIAAAGLHTIAEQLRKNVAAAEHLPQQLQEKIAALDTRLAALSRQSSAAADAAAAEADTLRAELAAVRAAETGKLEAAAEKISRAAADLAKAGEAPRPLRAAKAPAEAKPEPAASPASAEALAPAAPAAAVSAAPTPAVPKPTAEASASGLAPPPADKPPAPEPVASGPAASSATSVAAAVAAAEAMLRDLPTEEITETIVPLPMRPTDTTPPIAVEISAGPDQGMLSPPPRRKRAKNKTDDASPAPAEAASPDAAVSAGPRKSSDTNPILELSISDDTPLSPEGHYPAAATALTAPTAPPFPPRRPAKSPKPAPEPAAPPSVAEPAPEPAAAADDSPAADTALTSDGLTRLIVTAYIGIGNKLFIRGDGPGLRPDVGVPLQFVSIGKWRWETPDATAPLTVKLYKNDQQPCASPADVTLQPGHQHEVSADF